MNTIEKIELPASQVSSSMFIYGFIYTQLLKINITNDGVLKINILELSIGEGGSGQHGILEHCSLEISILKIDTV